MALPFLWMIATSLKTRSEANQPPTLGTLLPIVALMPAFGAAGVLIGQTLGGVLFALVSLWLSVRLLRDRPEPRDRDPFRREAVLLRILGASRSMLRGIVATEAVVLAAVAALVGGGFALLAAWALVVGLFELPFAPPVVDLLLLMLGTFLVTATFGGAGAALRPGRSPQVVLREDPI